MASLFREFTGFFTDFLTPAPVVDFLDGEAVVVVTGASRGIGAAVVASLAQECRGTLVLVSRDTEKMQSHADALRQTGSPSRFVVLGSDFSRVDAAQELVKELHRQGLVPTVLVNNAGVMVDAPDAAISDDHAFAALMVNLFTPQRLTVKLVGWMATRRTRTKVVTVGSMAAFTGFSGRGNYASAKAGMVTFLRSLRGSGLFPRTSLHYVTFGQVATDASQHYRRWWLPAMTEPEAASIVHKVIVGQRPPFLINPRWVDLGFRFIDPLFPVVSDMLTRLATRRRPKSGSDGPQGDVPSAPSVTPGRLTGG